ncbi:NINE protein [Alloscardovia omnicolens]|uniref:TM2 domain-containing protein n=1 Tax=Alloscardovia omnicolens TaxID=419015 RepID=UPI003A5DD130
MTDNGTYEQFPASNADNFASSSMSEQEVPATSTSEDVNQSQTSYTQASSQQQYTQDYTHNSASSNPQSGYSQPYVQQQPYAQQPYAQQSGMYSAPQPQNSYPHYTQEQPSVQQQPQYGYMPPAAQAPYNQAPYGAGSQVPPLMVGAKSKIVAAVLAFFLGFLGVHNFYLGKNTQGIIQLLMGTVGWFFIFPPIISGIWAFVEFILILVSTPGTSYHRDGQGYELQD